jgi:hypothetical protein
MGSIAIGLNLYVDRTFSIPKLAVVLGPATLPAFHKLLVRKKYQRLFTSTRKARPVPKGEPCDHCGYCRSKKSQSTFRLSANCLEIAPAFGVEIGKDVLRRVLEKYFRPRTEVVAPRGRHSSVTLKTVSGASIFSVANRYY